MSSYYNDGRGRTQPARRPSSQRGAGPSGGSSRRGGRRRKKKRNNALPITLLVLAVTLGAFAGYNYFKTQKEQKAQEEQQRLEQEAQDKRQQEDLVLEANTIYEGVSINGVALSGMTKEEAVSAVEANLGLSQHILTLTHEGQSFPVELLTGADLSDVVDQAYRVGREGTREENLAAIEKLKAEPVNFTVEPGYSLPDMTQVLASICSAVETAPVNATVTGFNVKDASFTYEEGKNGLAVDTEATLAAAKAAVETGNLDDNAAIVVKIVVKETPPQMDKATLKERFKKLASFTTKTTSNSNRNTNIRLCAEAISGTVVKQGEEFSVNGITGARTAAKGYKDATVIKNGVYIQEPGGGVCQVSSTLFNAVVRAGFDITERHNHTIVSSYVPIGEDAAIDYPHKDFKFVNNSAGPVAVVMSFDESGKKLKATVYGIPILEEGVTLDLESEITETLEIPEPKYTQDPSLSYGEEVVVTEGLEGKKVTTYLITKKDGKQTGKEVLHKSSYPKRTPVIAVNSAATPGAGGSIPEEGGGGSVPDAPGETPALPPDEGFDIPEE